MKTRYREPLSRHTTFRIGGPARVLAEPENEAEFIGLLEKARSAGEPFLVLGGGSNVLFRDSGFPGLVIKTSRALSGLAMEGGRLVCGAGVPLARLVGFALARGAGSPACLAGIPGTLGGALVGNAGSGREWISGSVLAVTVIDRDLNRLCIGAENIDFGYRTSSLVRYAAITGARLRPGPPEDPERIKKKIRKLMLERMKRQPRGLPCAGSIFRNPPGDFAGRLIDQAGCRGWREGDAQVSTRHANFIVNLGRANAGQVLALVDRVRRRVRLESGITLELEIRVV